MVDKCPIDCSRVHAYPKQANNLSFCNFTFKHWHPCYDKATVAQFPPDVANPTFKQDSQRSPWNLGTHLVQTKQQFLFQTRPLEYLWT